MALQTTRVFVEDDTSQPVEAVNVSFNDVATGSSFFAVTDSLGKAELPLEEEQYSVSVAKADFVSPKAFLMEVAPPPAPTAASFNPPAQAAPGVISSTVKNIELAVDGGLPFVIDVSGGDDVAVDATEIATNINTALGAAVASVVLGEVRLQSTTTGATSSIVITNDGSLPNDATDAVFGLDGSGDVTVLGEDTPTDWNDFDVALIPAFGFVATDPDHCVLWGKFYRHEVDRPLVGATVWVLVKDRPTAVDVGMDVGDSFYGTTDEDGIVAFELMRGVRATLFLQWQDKEIEFTVPDAASCPLDALLTPYAESLQISGDQAFSLAVGGTASLSLFFDRSDGAEITGTAGLRLITWVSDDATVASFDPGTPNKLVANAAGTVVVRATARNTRNELLTTPDVTVTVTVTI